MRDRSHRTPSLVAEVVGGGALVLGDALGRARWVGAVVEGTPRRPSGQREYPEAAVRLPRTIKAAQRL